MSSKDSILIIYFVKIRYTVFDVVIFHRKGSKQSSCSLTRSYSLAPYGKADACPSQNNAVSSPTHRPIYSPSPDSTLLPSHFLPLDTTPKPS